MEFLTKFCTYFSKYLATVLQVSKHIQSFIFRESESEGEEETENASQDSNNNGSEYIADKRTSGAS